MPPKSELDRFVRLALESGADDAVVVSRSEIILDPRVRLKCMIPKCYMSGGCEHCPPNGYSLPEVEAILAGFSRGIFFRVTVENSVIAAKDLGAAVTRGIIDNQGNLLSLGGHYILVFSIVKLLEKKAVDLGYGKTMGFAAGNCRDPLCHLRTYCRKLMTDHGCRHPDLSAPSLESCGMDAFTMAARVGWDVYPIGGTCQPDSLPRGSLMGLVLVD